MNNQFPCRYPLQIRFHDLDPLAHVNNTVYFSYFEEARSHYFDQLSPWMPQWPSQEEHQTNDRIFYHSNNFVMKEFYALLQRLSSHLSSYIISSLIRFITHRKRSGEIQ